MYFPDLSPYTYTHPESNTFNIGWLDACYDYPQGDVPPGFLTRLEQYMGFIIHNCCFGSHSCEFCANDNGRGEIRVFGTDGMVYAAPSMIDHYITVHRYRPPQVFIDAVIFGPTPGSVKYRALAQRYAWATQLK